MRTFYPVFSVANIPTAKSGPVFFYDVLAIFAFELYLNQILLSIYYTLD